MLAGRIHLAPWIGEDSLAYVSLRVLGLTAILWLGYSVVEDLFMRIYSR